MKILEQGSYINSVNRFNETEAISQALFLNTQFEASAVIIFDISTYAINDAYWSIHRAADPQARGEGRITELNGKSAYLSGGAAVKTIPDYSRLVKSKHAPGEPDEMPGSETSDNNCGQPSAIPNGDSAEWREIKELLLECIRGAFQAETYIIEYRGFSNSLDYEKYWQQDKKDYCRPYTGGMPGLTEWPDYIGLRTHYRTQNLYNKYKSYTLIERNDGLVYGVGTYNDSFHEMNIELDYESGTGSIKAFDMNAIRVPFAPCTQLSHLWSDRFIGKDITSIKKRDAGKLIGGSEGCFHLVDLITDMAAAAARHKY